jgi:DNA modification methylase
MARRARPLRASLADDEPAEWAEPGSLVAWPQNPRTYSKQEIDEVAASMRRLGFGAPIVARRENRMIIAGHRRQLAALRLGLDRVPVRFLQISEKDAKLLALADNRHAARAENDIDAFLRLVAAESWSPEDLGAAGWDPDSLAELAPPRVVEVAIPEPPANATTAPGDLWFLGRHRLLCGDATDPATVARLLAGIVPGIMVTDPPYGVSYDPKWRQEAAAAGHLSYSARRTGEVRNDDRADWSAAWALFPGAVVYAWAPAGPPQAVHQAALESAGFEVRIQIIWAKSHFPISRGHYHVRHEPCFYAVRRGHSAGWVGDRKQTTLWESHLDPNAPGGHSTQKPVELMARPMRNHAAPDVYEPFAGSGTTLIAAEQLGRRCFAMEIEPRYCDVVRARWEALTGQTAVLSGPEVPVPLASDS